MFGEDQGQATAMALFPEDRLGPGLDRVVFQI